MNECKEWSFIEYVLKSKPDCSSFDLSGGDDNEMISDLVTEHLNIGAAKINVHKLLGVHEQGQLQDLTGNGIAISGGDGNAHPAFSAFNKLCGEWRSNQRGADVIKSSFIGYDFGPIRDNDTNNTYYSVDTFHHVHIATIKIQQGMDKKNRANRIRVERSQDGSVWYGVEIITLPDDGLLHTIHFKGSAASRFWRLRPIEFVGGETDWWAVSRLEMHDYEETSLTNIQYDAGFMELRDRDYAEKPIVVKMFYDIVDVQSELTPFGLELETQQMYFTISFKDAIQKLGRPMVIGDILDVTSEVQYTPSLVAVKKYLEVTDVAWSIEGYTPGWQPTMQRIVAVPMLASQETLDITGEVKQAPDEMGFLDIDTSQLVDLTEINARVRAADDTNVPLRGADSHKVYNFSEEEIEDARAIGVNVAKLNVNQRALYIEDGLPPNNEKYTEGTEFPKNPRDGDWHRLTYQTSDSRIPPRLHKFSGNKLRWIFYETDRRQQYDVLKPTVQDLITSQTKVPNNKVRK